MATTQDGWRGVGLDRKHDAPKLGEDGESTRTIYDSSACSSQTATAVQPKCWIQCWRRVTT